MSLRRRRWSTSADAPFRNERRPLNESRRRRPKHPFVRASMETACNACCRRFFHVGRVPPGGLFPGFMIPSGPPLRTRPPIPPPAPPARPRRPTPPSPPTRAAKPPPGLPHISAPAITTAVLRPFIFTTPVYIYDKRFYFTCGFLLLRFNDNKSRVHIQ